MLRPQLTLAGAGTIIDVASRSLSDPKMHTTLQTKDL